MTSRRRSASSTAPARTAAWGGVDQPDPRHPPLPPPSTGTADPDKAFVVAAIATSRCSASSDRPGTSEISDKSDFSMPPTPEEATAGGGGRLDAVDDAVELAPVQGGGTYAEGATGGLHHGSRRYNEERLLWKLETERRDTRRRLEAMKGEVERVVEQFRARAERAEAAALSAEKRAKIKALRYLRSKKPQLG